jgi:hypothetical protein
MMSNWINTKVELEWDQKSQTYIEVYKEGFEYDGPMALAQDVPDDREARYPKTAFGGSQVPLDTRPDVGDVMTDTQKVTAGYFTGGGGTLNGVNIYTASLADSNEKYYFNVAQTHPLSSSAATQFSVAYGHAGGSGSNIDDGNIKGETEVVYGQWSTAVLGENEVSGGFRISQGGSAGIHFADSARDEDIYVLVGKRERFKDRINKKNWTLSLSGSTSNSIPDTTGAPLLKLTDDSATQDATATIVGPRYNIVSGSNGAVAIAAATRTFGWFYPEMGAMVFSAAELSASIPGTLAGTNMTASFDKQGASNIFFLSCSGFGANLSAQGNQQNALRFVNCLSYTDSSLTMRSEEDQVAVSYFCRVKSQQMNHSNNPTFVSGSFNEIRHKSMWGNPTVYVTGVGLFNPTGMMVAQGKLSTPLKKNYSSEATIKVKLTY